MLATAGCKAPRPCGKIAPLVRALHLGVRLARWSRTAQYAFLRVCGMGALDSAPPAPSFCPLGRLSCVLCCYPYCSGCAWSCPLRRWSPRRPTMRPNRSLGATPKSRRGSWSCCRRRSYWLRRLPGRTWCRPSRRRWRRHRLRASRSGTCISTSPTPGHCASSRRATPGSGPRAEHATPGSTTAMPSAAARLCECRETNVREARRKPEWGRPWPPP